MKYKFDSNRGEVDTGCKYAENCFECPFPDCIISMNEVCDTEDDYTIKREVVLERAKYVKSLRDGGMKIAEIASALNCTRETVKKDLIIAKTEEEKENACENGCPEDR